MLVQLSEDSIVNTDFIISIEFLHDFCKVKFINGEQLTINCTKDLLKKVEEYDSRFIFFKNVIFNKNYLKIVKKDDSLSSWTHTYIILEFDNPINNNKSTTHTFNFKYKDKDEMDFDYMLLIGLLTGKDGKF